MKKRIQVGSKAFFEGMPDFQPKDTDVLIWDDEPKGYKDYRQTSMSGRCTIEWRAMSKEELLEHAKREKASGLEFGKFLVPDFAELVGLTIADLKALRNAFRGKIDAKHEYQLLIYSAYEDNNAFTMTEEQRAKAYQLYRDARNTDAEESTEE